MDLQSAIYRYCNYQERCHQEVRNKLYELGATTPEVESLITDLIEANLLNEERFAKSFSRGKFSHKKWGKGKIRRELKMRKISDYCIKKGLAEIDEDEYERVLEKLAERWWDHYKGAKPQWAREMKTIQYLVSRGFESLPAKAAVQRAAAGET
jgi:regulatory protein